MVEILKNSQENGFLRQWSQEAVRKYADLARLVQKEPLAAFYELGTDVVPILPGSVEVPGGFASPLVPEAVRRMRDVDTIIGGIHTGGSPRIRSSAGPQTAKGRIDSECSCGLTGDNDQTRRMMAANLVEARNLNPEALFIPIEAQVIPHTLSPDGKQSFSHIVGEGLAGYQLDDFIRRELEMGRQISYIGCVDSRMGMFSKRARTINKFTGVRTDWQGLKHAEPCGIFIPPDEEGRIKATALALKLIMEPHGFIRRINGQLYISPAVPMLIKPQKEMMNDQLITTFVNLFSGMDDHVYRTGGSLCDEFGLIADMPPRFSVFVPERSKYMPFWQQVEKKAGQHVITNTAWPLPENTPYMERALLQWKNPLTKGQSRIMKF